MIVDALIKGALRKLGALASGVDIPASEASEALETLRQMYLEMVGAGTFGRQADVSVPVDATDFTAREGRRYTVEQLRGIAITLPEAVQDCWFRWDWPRRYGSQWIPPAIAETQEPWGIARPPRDGALVTASDLSSDTTRTFVYDAAIGRWTSLQDIDYGDVAPLSTRYGEGLMCELALRLAPEYGMEPSVAIVRGASQGRSAMVCRFDGPARVVRGVFY